LITLALLGVAFKYAWTQPYDGLEWSQITYQVEKVDGPAAEAGLHVGDAILQLDGAPIKEVHPLYGNKKAGERVLFTVLREGKPQQLELTLEQPSPGILALRMQPIIVALGFWLFSTILLVLKPASGEVRLFFFFSQLGVMVLTAGEVSTFLVDWASRLFNLSLCLLSPLTIHLHLAFPEIKTFPRKRFLLGLLYGLGLALFLPFILLGPRLTASPWHPLLYSLARLYFALSILVAVVSLVHTYITTPSERRRIRLVVFGTALAFAPLVLFSLLPELLLAPAIFPYEISFPFLILIPLSYAYAISRYKLVQMDLVLNRSVVYFAIGLIWAGLYLTSVMALDVLLPSVMIGRPLLGALITLIMAAFFAPLKERIQALVDRAFYGGWYDYRRVINGVSRGLSQALDATQLVEFLVNGVSATLQLRGAALFLAESDDSVTLRGSVGFKEEITSAQVRGDGPLARFLRSNAEPIETSRLRQVLEDDLSNSRPGSHARQLGGPSAALRTGVGAAPADFSDRLLEDDLSGEERALLAGDEVRLWLPLVSKEELQGVLLLGARPADEPFDAEDHRILGTLAQQAALAAENVRLVEELRHRLAESEEAHQRLLCGREEERKRLARELHDRVVQDLIRLSHQLGTCQGLSKSSPLDERLEATRGEMLRLLDELRRICNDLRPPTLDIFGLDAAIRSHVDAFSTQWSGTIDLDLAKDDKDLPEEAAISLFRACQEALANVARHAEATRVQIRLSLSSDGVELSVRDDGRGFVVPSRLGLFAKENRLGLLGMKEQIELVEGELQVISQPGEGTEIKAQVPLNHVREKSADSSYFSSSVGAAA
jgi:signal transduction histidine kinase